MVASLAIIMVQMQTFSFAPPNMGLGDNKKSMSSRLGGKKAA